MGKSKDGKKKKGKKGDHAPAGVVGEDDITPDKSRPGCVEDYYKIGPEIGRGGMSVVHEGTDTAKGTRWAVKFIDKSVVDDLVVLQREIDIMKKLKNRNVLQLREVFETSNQIQLVTELVSGGELFEKIVEYGSYSEADAANIIRQVCDGVQYLHENGVAHRDLKPENLLVGEGDGDDIVIKIADFGLSKTFGAGPDGQLVTSCGTPDYVAPEVLRGEQYEMSVDLWSVGVITYILLCGFPPFWGESQGELFDKILSVDYDFPSPEWDAVSSAAKDFIKSLLVKDAKERFTAKQCIDHPWLKDAAKKGTKKGELRSLDSIRGLEKYQNETIKNRKAGK